MISSLTILLVITFFVLVLGVTQYFIHQKKLRQIPIRIHVNGTRGKSSVTRLIAAGLRSGGISTCAKTTGTLPRMIMPDGKEYPIFRPGRANIGEQLRIVEVAQTHNAKALVIECMALQPSFQSVSELKMIKATHGVITNARPDHLDVMGPTPEDVALALCGMVPKKAKLFTAEEKQKEIILSACKDRETQMIKTGEEDAKNISDEEMKGFSYTEHKENVALALKVCEDLGVARTQALQGMYEASPDPGVLRDYTLDFFGKKIYFANGFAANDPDSTKTVWDMMVQKFPDAKKRILLFNCRADRPERSLQFGESVSTWNNFDDIVLMGNGAYLFARSAMNAGIDYGKIHFADDMPVEEIFEEIVGLISTTALVVGIGNIGGDGLKMVQFFSNRSVV